MLIASEPEELTDFELFDGVYFWLVWLELLSTLSEDYDNLFLFLLDLLRTPIL